MIDRPDVRLFRPIKGGLLFVFCLLAVFPGFGKQQGRGTEMCIGDSSSRTATTTIPAVRTIFLKRGFLSVVSIILCILRIKCIACKFLSKSPVDG